MDLVESKRCCTCGEVRPLDLFNRRTAAKDGRQDRCRLCSRAWYEANRDTHIRNVRKNALVRLEENRRRVVAYLLEHGCVDCGEPDIRCLDFDHVRGKKTRSVSAMISEGLGWETIAAEIAKCDVRCANCHRRVTFERADFYRQRSWQEHTSAQHGMALNRLEAALSD